MVSFNYLKKYFGGKKVFLTGHTGFKGTWFLQILSQLGAEVKGFSLPPQNDFDLYPLVNGDSLCKSSVFHDIRDAERLRHELLHFEPDFIFHMAAQPLVLEAYQEPLYTFEVNIQGTANVLDAVRFLSKRCACVLITTDKVYENHDEHRLFHEDDKLGGFDPYSASKAGAEIVISSYRSSFFNSKNIDKHQKAIASVRAGNVIGGGDFAKNRIIPDIIDALKGDREIILRNPAATRPWQHVLEPLGAYLLLAAKLTEEPTRFNTSFNIGPHETDVLPVEKLTSIAIETAGKGRYKIFENDHKPHEAATLMLDITKAKDELGWQPSYDAATAIQKTIAWYFDKRPAAEKCLEHINEYFQRSSHKSIKIQA